jgi:hypothetical protein
MILPLKTPNRALYVPIREYGIEPSIRVSLGPNVIISAANERPRPLHKKRRTKKEILIDLL